VIGEDGSGGVTSAKSMLGDSFYATVLIPPPNIPGEGSLLICWKFIGEHPVPDPAIFPAIPDRVETFILTIINRRNAFTVLGLIFMRVAISLLVRPCRMNSTVSPSR
jgi:hypothetical protein